MPCLWHLQWFIQAKKLDIYLYRVLMCTKYELLCTETVPLMNHKCTVDILVLMYFQMRKYDQTVLKSPGIKTGKSFKSHLPNVFNQSSEGSKFAFPSSKSSTTVSLTISTVPVLSWILWVSQSYADLRPFAKKGSLCVFNFSFYYFIVINIILVDVFHDVKEKNIKQLCFKKDIKNYIVWNMGFKRLVLNVCSLSLALNKNGKLLNLLYNYNGGQCIFSHHSCLGNQLCLMENCCWTQSCLLLFYIYLSNTLWYL